MKKRELKKLTFEEAIEKLEEENNYITTYSILKEFAIDNINNDNLLLAIHILQALEENEAEYYNYDYSAGTFETPTPIESLEDLEDFCR